MTLAVRSLCTTIAARLPLQHARDRIGGSATGTSCPGPPFVLRGQALPPEDARDEVALGVGVRLAILGEALREAVLQNRVFASGLQA